MPSLNGKRPNSGKYDVRPTHTECYYCQIEKPFTIEFFNKKSRSSFGLSFLCKECDSKIRKENHSKTPASLINARNKRWREANQIAGKCIKCSKERMEFSNTLCETHWFKDMARKHLGTYTRWKELKDKLLFQDNKCFYTGVELVKGATASIDHVKSISKYPELKKESTNLVWCDIRINVMKRAHDVDEFIQLCKMVVDYNESNKK